MVEEFQMFQSYIVNWIFEFNDKKSNYIEEYLNCSNASVFSNYSLVNDLVSFVEHLGDVCFPKKVDDPKLWLYL